MRGERIQIALKAGLHTIKPQADGGPTLNAGLVAFVIFHGILTNIAKKLYSFVIFQGGGGGI